MENHPNSPSHESVTLSLRNRVETYLRETYSWHFTSDEIDRDFRAALNVPDEQAHDAAEAIAAEAIEAEAIGAEAIEYLSNADRVYYVEMLSSRGVFTQSEIQTIAEQLESIRLEVLSAIETRRQQAVTSTLRQRVEHYLIQTPKEELISGTFPAFQALLDDREATFESLNQQLSPYSREELRQILVQRLTHRQDITYKQMGQILDALEITRDRLLAEARGRQVENLDAQPKTASASSQQVMVDPAPSLEEPDPQRPEATPNAQGAAPHRSGAYTWSTWGQANWKPTEKQAQTTERTLSWSTWGEITQKASGTVAPQPSAQAPRQSATILTWSTWNQLPSQPTVGEKAERGEEAECNAPPQAESALEDTPTPDEEN